MRAASESGSRPGAGNIIIDLARHLNARGQAALIPPPVPKQEHCANLPHPVSEKELDGVTTEQESAVLATLEDECDKEIKPKWKGKSDTLASFCGILPMKR